MSDSQLMAIVAIFATAIVGIALYLTRGIA
jgi:hypothetical protein